MRLLFVEDDISFLQEVVPDVEKVIGKGNVVVARSRDAACQLMSSDIFDAYLLDLKIPSSDDALDETVDHGRAMFYHARATSPGTPIYFLTGSSADDFYTELLRDHAERDDIWGDRQAVPIIQLQRKVRLADLLAELEKLKATVDAVDDVEIVTHGQDLGLSRPQKRILRIFARRRGGCICEISNFSGGLSGSRVLRVVVRDSGGVEMITAVGKIGELEDVDDEVRRFDMEVPRLRPGAFPQKVEVVRSGAKNTAGVFYRLADDYKRSLFSILREQPSNMQRVVEGVKDLLEPWGAGVPTASRLVRDVRRRLVQDGEFANVVKEFGLEWVQELETARIQVRTACIHGDLHGGNVLLAADQTPILIDFGDAGLGCAAIDPITLELCMIFHPEMKGFCEWPSIEDTAFWANDVGRYLRDCPYADFVRNCRDWAHLSAAGAREVYASAIAYLLRQLKYQDTDKKICLALLHSAREAFNATY